MDVTGVIDAVAREYGVRPAEITSRSRRQPIAVARQVVIYLLRNTTGSTLCEIGASVGRHHATVHYAITSIDRRRISDLALNDRIRRLTREITG